MRSLNFVLHKICLANQSDLSRTQRDRYNHLQMAANDLWNLGYKVKHPLNLKPKHVRVLVSKWQEPDDRSAAVSVGTIKNRLSSLRWLVTKIGKTGIVESNNSAYGVE